MAKDVCRVVLTCRLTKDPELRQTQSGTAVASLRVAWTTSRRSASGDWEDKSNFGDVVVWGGQAETCARYLAKGRRIAVDGRLEWREWQAQDGTKRQALEVVAEGVTFLDKAPDGQGTPFQAGDQPAPAEQYAPAAEPAASSGYAAGADDDIPFLFIDMYSPQGHAPVHVERWTCSGSPTNL